MNDDHSTQRNALASLAARYWSATLDAHPTVATFLGDHSRDDRLEDLSEDAERSHRVTIETIGLDVAAIDPSTLDDAGRVTRSLLLHQTQIGVDAADLRLAEMASDQMTGPHAELLMVAPQLTYPEPAQAEAALIRYAQIPRMLGQAIDRFRSGLTVGRTPAAAVVDRSIHSITAYLETPVESDPFLATGLPPGDDATSEWSGAPLWRAEMAALVRERIRPSFEMYRNVLRDELATAARDDDHAGWSHLPGGDEMYAALLRAHTTLDVSPQTLHELGRHHTEDLLVHEYQTIGRRHFGTGDLQTIFTRLRTDPSLRHRDSAEIVQIAESTVARATTAMTDWFGRVPTVACQVARVPEFMAADAPYAYYFPPATDGTRAGTYFINASDPEHASRAEAESIAFHEAVPGHHLQIAISQELDGLPDFQRHDGATSYIEGWALYAERLADEMGLYTDDVALLGMLTADSWRSARLVVDTGLHAFGWSRQQALDYFESHTPVPMDQVATEVDRYLAMPAQAVSYKVGQLEIQRLRAMAEEQLADSFDVSAFHDVVLGSGAVTLPVLGELVDRWIAGR